MAEALVALSLSGCGAPPDNPAGDRSARRAAEQTAEEIDTSARLRVTEQRIARLERQVAELQASPTAVDNDLLKQRLNATEAALYARSRAAAEQPAPASSPAAASPPLVATPRLRAGPVPTASPKLQLVDPKLFDPRSGENGK